MTTNPADPGNAQLPTFMLRIWREETNFGARDYDVTAPTLSEAAAKLLSAQHEAQHDGRPVTHPHITPHHPWGAPQVQVLDPSETNDYEYGVTLIADNGDRVRDLIGVPTGAAREGQPLCGEDGPPCEDLFTEYTVLLTPPDWLAQAAGLGPFIAHVLAPHPAGAFLEAYAEANRRYQLTGDDLQPNAWAILAVFEGSHTNLMVHERDDAEDGIDG